MALPRYKSVYVTAQMATIEKDGFFGAKTETSLARIDPLALTSNTEAACNLLDAQGYEVIAVTALANGNFQLGDRAGAGWSYTAGVIITARHKA